VADAGSSEFTITGSPITSSGTINLAVNSINATKIGSGNVDNTELGYLNGVTSNIQTQLDNSASLGDAISFAVALGS
jgi:cell division inhibitor SulA